MATANSTRVCSIDDCHNPFHSQGLCQPHYRRVKSSGSPYRPCVACGSDLPLGTNPRTKRCTSCRTCTVPGCAELIRRNDVCNSHAGRLRRNGSTDLSCRNCGKEIVGAKFEDDRGSFQHYCSDSCRPECKAPNCGNPAIAKGMCKRHWNRHRGTGDMYRYCHACGKVLDYDLFHAVKYCSLECAPKCSAPGCLDPSEDKGYCARHGLRVRYHGYLPELDYQCAICEVHVERSYGDRWQRSNALICPQCRVKKNRDHNWYRKEVLSGLVAAVCGICSESIDLSLKSPDRMALEIDHIIPITRGGSNRRRNLQPSHAACNLLKRNNLALPIEGVLTLF